MSVGAAAEIKSRLDLVEVIGESVPLKKAGNSFKGLCPFHGEKTPSFIVTPARESWKCFGCGLGGDVFSFVMQRDAIDFPEALRRLAPRAGVELDERTSREDARRKRLQQVLESAVAFYHRVLTESRHGRRALDYLRGRGFTDETIARHQLGYAPPSWDVLTRALVERRSIRRDELEAVGLVVPRQGGSGVYDRFRDRVIFPIRDASGGPTGLGGRLLEEGPDRGPKYLNTPATVLFDKSRTLYLIDKAKAAIRRGRLAILVEGNVDALMAHQAGFENVVATLGTSLTPGQIELVTRYAPSIALAYDVDDAGQSAATFGARELSTLVGEIERSPHRGRLTDVRVVRLPAGRDPDEVIRDEPETWRKAVEERQPIVEYLIDRFAARHDPRSVEGRNRLVQSVLPVLRSIGDPVRRDGYLQVLARRSGVEERVLLEALRRGPVPVGPGRRDDAHGGPRIDLEAVLSTPGALDPAAVARALEPVESALLRLLLLDADQARRVRDRLAPEDLLTTPARELWRALRDELSGDGEAGHAPRFDRSGFLARLDATLAALARTLYARTDPVPEGDAIEQAIDQCLLRLESRRLFELFEYRRAELAEAEAAGDETARDRLQGEIRELQVERAALDRRLAETSLLRKPNRNQERIATPTGGTP